MPRLTRPSGANPSIAGVDECVRYMIGTSERGTPRRAPAVAAPAGSRDPLTARPFCDVRRHRPARRLPAAARGGETGSDVVAAPPQDSVPLRARPAAASRDGPYSHSIINSFGKSLSDLMLAS